MLARRVTSWTCRQLQLQPATATSCRRHSISSHLWPHTLQYSSHARNMMCCPFSCLQVNELQFRDLPALRYLRSSAVTIVRFKPNMTAACHVYPESCLSTATSGPESGRLCTSASSRRLEAMMRATCTMHKGRGRDVSHLCGRVRFGSATNPLDFGVINSLGLLAV